MRFEFDTAKSRDVKRKHGISLKEAQEIFDQVYLVDQKNGDPEQFRVIRVVSRVSLFRDIRDQARF